MLPLVMWRSSRNIATASFPRSRVFLQFLAIWGNESNNGQQETSLTRFRRTSYKILTDESRRAHRNQLRRLRPVVPQKRELTYRSENVQNWHRRSGLETKYVHTTRSLLEARNLKRCILHVAAISVPKSPFFDATWLAGCWT